MAIFSIRNFAIKQLMKSGDDGIMKMPSNMKADFAEAMLTKQLVDAGIDPRLIKNEQQLVNVLDGIDDMNRQLAEMATKESKGIMKSKQADLFNLQGEKLNPNKPIIGGTQEGKKINREFFERNAAAQTDVNSFIKGIKSMDPIEAMKEANKVIKREGPYKNLTGAEAKKILNDTEDHIFQRDPVPGEFDPDIEDFQKGGRVGLKGGADAATESFTKSAGSSAKGRKGSVSVSPSGNVTFNPGGKDDPVDDRSTFEQTINQRNIVDRSKEPKKSLLKNLYDAGQEFNYLRNLAIGNFPGIGKQLLLDYGRKKFFDDQSMLDQEGIINGLSENQFAELTDMQKKMLEGPQKNLKDIMGISNQEILKNIEKFNDPDAPATIEDIEQFYQQAKDGGRIGLKDGMNRRTFMKAMAGLASIPIVGKLFKGAKVASKAAPKKVIENFSTTLPEPPTYFLKLVDKITKQGKPVTSTEDIMETYIYTSKNGDSYELVNDLKTGDLRITKDKSGIGNYGDKSFDTIEDRTVLEYKAPKEDVDIETGRGTKQQGEYEEYRVEFDQDGTEAGADAIEELVQKEIIEESASEAPSIKKADGGRVGLLSGGGILRVILTNLAKDKGMKPSEYLRLTNYKSLPDSTKRMISKDEFLKLKSDMTEKRVELMDTVKEMIVSRQGFERSKDDLRKSMNTASEGYGDKAVEMMFPPGSFKSPVPAGSGQKDVMMMEQLIKNLKTKDRQLNASGGVAYMLGE